MAGRIRPSLPSPSLPDRCELDALRTCPRRDLSASAAFAGTNLREVSRAGRRLFDGNVTDVRRLAAVLAASFHFDRVLGGMQRVRRRRRSYPRWCGRERRRSTTAAPTILPVCRTTKTVSIGVVDFWLTVEFRRRFRWWDTFADRCLRFRFRTVRIACTIRTVRDDTGVLALRRPRQVG
jgi:hypothetical protein